MNSKLGTRLPRPRGIAWPARPGRRPAPVSRLLTAARWRQISARLGAHRTPDRRAVEAALWILYTGKPWSALGAAARTSVVRAQWQAWLRDGRWVDFWTAYVSLLSTGQRALWQRALSTPGGPAQRVWRLVSARLLLDRI
ncbi:MAG TPA: hypothetical protein VKF80_05570 [Candidatus Eisenbacteria bacterium]|nr:hypothetical protein [Candidatus Eisenbacteria bacterium]